MAAETVGRGRARIRKLVGEASKSGNLGGPRPPGFSPNDPCSLPKTNSGRGFSDAATEQMTNIERGLSSLKTLDEVPATVNKNTSPLESPKKTLEKDLEHLKDHGVSPIKKCLIRITIEFFTHDNDVEFYIDQVVTSTLDSPLIGKMFAMSLKFLIHHKLYGEEIQKHFLSKLQSCFENMSIFMKESSNLPPEAKTRLVNFCNLIGQLYFRFRPVLETPERFPFLAAPTISCLDFLLSAGGTLEMRTLAQLFMMNCKALCDQHKDKVVNLYNEARCALVKRETTSEERLWLLCVIETFHLEGNHLPDNVSSFYALQAGKPLWRDIALEKTSDNKIVLLANLPIDFNRDDAKIFDLDISHYSRQRFVDL